MNERVAGLDLLRALAIIGVVLAHTLPFLYSHQWRFAYGGHLGSMGVDLFFVLSGYLIGGLLWRLGPRLASLREVRDFWYRRWLRTLPAFYAFFLLTVALAVWAYARPPSVHEAFRVATFTQNLAWTLPTVFPEAWTLAVEEWFYLTLPLGLWLGLQITGRFKWVWWSGLAVMLMTPLVLRCLQDLPTSWGAATRQPVVFRLDALATGVAMATLRAEWPVAWRRVRYWALAAGMALVTLSYVLLYRLPLDASWFANTLWFNLTSVGYALLLPWASEKRRFANRAWSAVVRHTALWSYSLYLCNVGVVVALQHHWEKQIQASPAAAVVAVIAAWILAFGIAAGAYHGIERPFLRLRERVTSGPSGTESPAVERQCVERV